MRLGVLATHPIQYHAPLYRALARELDLHVYFAHRQTAEGQAKAGFGVAFEWDVPLTDGYTYRYLPNQAKRPDVSTFLGCHTPEIRRVIARERFDAFLVNGWYNRSFLQAITACWRTGTPLLVRGDSQLRTRRSALKRWLKESVYRAFIPRFDAYLIVGERAKEYLLHYGADPGRMVFTPHFVDNEAFSQRAAKAEPRVLRHQMGINDDVTVLLFVGKFIPKKRPADVIRAAQRLHEQGQCVHVVMVGAGPLEESLRAEARAVDASVHFVGFKNQTELPAYYAAADLLVLPSEGGETWGLVVNESMACGTPAVVSEAVGCAPDLIDAGKTGETFPVGDVTALASAVQHMRGWLDTASSCRALATKMKTYSLETAVGGVLRAVDMIGRSARSVSASAA